MYLRICILTSAVTQDETSCTLQEPEWCNRILSSLLDELSTHDVTFKTSNGGSVSGHRAIVAAGSPMFHAMLYGNMKESNEKEIELRSVDTETFKSLLSFVYTGKVKLDANNCYKILEAAEYFIVTALENKCVDFIAGLLDTKNFCTIAAFANSKNSLLERCNAFLKRRVFINKIIHDAEFVHIPVQSVTEICSRSEICVKEIDLFLAVKAWINNNQDSLPEDTIKNVLQFIRYPLICATDLIEKVNPTRLVNPSLYQAALEYRLSSNKGYKGLQEEQANLRAYYFDFHVLYGTGIFIKQTPKGTIITKRKGVACTCFADLIHTRTPQFKVCIKRCSDSSNDESIELLLGYKAAIGNYARIAVADLTLNEEYDGIVSEKDGYLEIKVGSKKATVAIQHNWDVETLAVCMRNVRDQIMITKT